MCGIFLAITGAKYTTGWAALTDYVLRNDVTLVLKNLIGFHCTKQRVTGTKRRSLLPAQLAREGVAPRGIATGNASNFYGRAVYYPNYGTRPPHNGREVRAARRAQLQYAGCYSTIVAAFIANRLSADSLVL